MTYVRVLEAFTYEGTLLRPGVYKLTGAPLKDADELVGQGLIVLLEPCRPLVPLSTPDRVQPLVLRDAPQLCGGLPS